MYIYDQPDRALSGIGIYADDTTAYSSIQTSDIFDRLEMTAELEEDLRFIVEWGEKWLVSFNTKLLSFFIATVKINDIELPECVSFHLLGLVFTPKLDWKPYIQSVARISFSIREIPYT